MVAMLGVSSMKTGASARLFMAGASRVKSISSRKPGAQSLRVDVGDRAEQPQDELLLAHLEAEDADRAALADRGVLGDVERQRLSCRCDGRAATMTRSELLEPGRQGVEVLEAGSNAADLTLVLVQVVEAVVGRVKQRS